MKVVAVNKEAERNYTIEERIEAGIELKGTEVKSLRNGAISLRNGYARIKNDEVYLCNVNIPEYKCGSFTNHDPKRERKLLLHKNEIRRLIGKQQQKGYTLIPLKVYFKNKWAKVELGLAKGKSKIDRREQIKEEEQRRAMDRALKKAILKNIK